LLGWNIGTYIQDEWRLTRELTLNAGLRFDQLYQFVDANQFSPRLALIYKPFPGTSIHAGYARYFTPPYQAQATQSNLALFTNTTNQPEVPLNDPVKPERSNYYDEMCIRDSSSAARRRPRFPSRTSKTCKPC